VTVIAVHVLSFIHQHNAFFMMMFICTFEATFFISAEFNHMIKINASEALNDATVLFKQFTDAFLI